MLGRQPRDTYLTAAEVLTRLERLASLAPVREHTPVIAVASRGDAWTIRTATALRHRRRPPANQASPVRHWACQTLGLSDIGYSAP